MRRRRRRNPVKAWTAAQWALLAGAAWLVYKYVWPVISTAATGVQSATGAVSAAIANAYVAATSGPAIAATHQVMLPDGTDIPMQQIGATGTLKDTTQPGGATSATFTWNGVNYVIVGPSDASGTFYAQAVS